MQIRALRPEDNRAAFHSGDDTLDRFFHRYAAQNQFRHYLGVTYVALEHTASPGRIVGFATVAPRHIDIDDLPQKARKALPRYPVPVLGLARLAVDLDAQAMGVGSQLLRFVCQLALRLAGEVGCVGVVVDAKPDATAFYAKYGFTPFDVLEGSAEARPRPIAMWLPIRAIRAALPR